MKCVYSGELKINPVHHSELKTVHQSIFHKEISKINFNLVLTPSGTVISECTQYCKIYFEILQSFSKSLKFGILYLNHISIWTSHISSVQ